MPRYTTILLIGVFAISAVLHMYLQHKIAQCRRSRNQAFYSGWFSAGWPYAVACGLIGYVLPPFLTCLGFGPVGILSRSIAARIQSVYGISSIFSLLQSLGARGGVSNSLISGIGLGQVFQAIKKWFWGDDYVAQCVNYYESLLTYLSILDLVFIVVCSFYSFYWHFIRRRWDNILSNQMNTFTDFSIVLFIFVTLIYSSIFYRIHWNWKQYSSTIITDYVVLVSLLCDFSF
jgi:hypothetical protein